MIEKIDKTALSHYGQTKMNECCIRFRANIECNEKNLVDFSLMGAHCINHCLKMKMQE